MVSSVPFAISGSLPKFNVGITSSRVQLTAAAEQNCLVTSAPTNAGIVHIRFGNGNVVATLDDQAILPGSANTFTITSTDSHIAGITESGSAVLHVSIGRGA